MRHLLKRYWIVVPLLLLAILVRDWVEESPSVVPLEDTLDMRETRADYYLEGFTTHRYTEDGSLAYRVSGDTLAHYPIDDRSEIVAPRLSLFRDELRWRVQSATGDLTRDPDIFTLRGDVELVRESSSNAPIVMRTTNLAIAPGNNRVSTDEPIEIVAPAWQLRSVGLESSLDDGRLTLLSAVTGHYELPPSRDRGLAPDAENQP